MSRRQIAKMDLPGHSARVRIYHRRPEEEGDRPWLELEIEAGFPLTDRDSLRQVESAAMDLTQAIRRTLEERLPTPMPAVDQESAE